MSPQAGRTLVSRILPLITAAVARGAVRPVGSEDTEELVQDALALAARFIESAEQNNRPVIPSSFAYYAIQRLKSGRRSANHPGADAMSPQAQIQSGVGLDSMDAQPDGDHGENPGLSLHELLDAPGEDPAAIACRQTDWTELLEGMSRKRRSLVRDIAEGFSGREIANRLRVSPPRIVQLKREIAADIEDDWGEGVLDEAGRKPQWMNGITARRERTAYRYAMMTL